MRIRPGTIDDARLIADLNVVVQELHYKAHPDHFTPSDSGAFVQTVARWLGKPNVHAFVAVDDDGAPLGYVLAIRHQRPASPLTHAREFLELDQIAVLPQLESQGIGRALALEVFRLANDLGLQRIELSVWDFNDRAQRFFSSLGFATTQRRMAAPNLPSDRPATGTEIARDTRDARDPVAARPTLRK